MTGVTAAAPRQPWARVARTARPDAGATLLAEALAGDGVAVGRRAHPAGRGTRPASTAVVVPALSPPAAADPALVHELVDLLDREGWSHIVVAGALTVFDRDRGHEELVSLARAAGYSGRTRAGTDYALADLGADTVPADVDGSSVLAGQQVSRLWAGAGLRVVVARNVTDADDGFALCLSVLLGVAGPVPGAAPGDVVAALLRDYAPQLALVDALVSSHGPCGNAALDPLETRTVIAGNDALLVDLAGAALQGIDPARSRLCAAAMRARPAPELDRIEGDLTPFAGWRGPRRPPAPPAATPARLAQLLRASGGADEPGGDAVVRALRALLGGGNPGSGAALRWFTAGATALSDQARAWSTVFAKDRLDRVELPLGFELADHSHADYDAVPAVMAPFDRLLADTPAGAGGLRWRYVGDAVVFEATRTVEAPYDAFVERVDIASGIALMADYIGGRVVPVSRDRRGRVVRQAERNVYLPQPNYLAFWGGAPIDVGKLELVDYSTDHCRLSWRTIVSPNNSAEYDDGSLTFAADGPDHTILTVRGRQLFALPPFWQTVDLDRYPAMKDLLVADAYRRFLTATFDNLEACYEGRDFRVGREPAEPGGPLPTAGPAALLQMSRDWLAERPLSERLRAARGRPGPRRGVTDGDGFEHFSAPTTPAPERPPAGRNRAWRSAAEAVAKAGLGQVAEELRSAWLADVRRLGGR